MTLEMPISCAREHFSDITNAAAYAGEITYVTRRGKRIAAVVPAAIAEAAARAEDAADVAAGEAALRSVANGEPTTPLAELRAKWKL